ncbi:MAG: MotA/TolQ/ExbB proton channel family protein [Pseudomonadales bacterium]
MQEIDESQQRTRVMLLMVGVSIAFVAILSFVLDSKGVAGAFLLDLGTKFLPYPLTIQNVMWVMFFVTAGEIYIRYRRASVESAQLKLGLLDEDPETMLVMDDLGDINAQAKRQGGYFLQRLVNRSILQFQSSGSVDQTNSLLNSSLELMQHEVDTRYSMIRYLVWVIPTFGFIGTVMGIAFALGEVQQFEDTQSPDLIKALTLSLGVAFYTTLLALVQSTVLVFALHIAQAKEELTLNKAGQYCLDHLINKLYERK